MQDTERAVMRIVVDEDRLPVDAREDPVQALDRVTLDVAEGEFVSVIGPSGCGKSTLFNIVGGLIGEYEGDVRIGGRAVDGAHRDVGVVFQEESTFPWRTVLENVAFPLEAARVPKNERLEIANHFVQLVGLDGFEDRYPAELSGGMRQRTAIARTLAFEPKILLMDEPFASLDEQTRLLLGDKVLQIQEELEQTALLITPNKASQINPLSTAAVKMYNLAINIPVGGTPIRANRARANTMASTGALVTNPA